MYLSEVRVKIEGDGAPVSRQTNLCMLNVAIVDDNPQIFKASGRQILACVAGQESYDLWATCFQDQIRAINNLADKKKILTTHGEIEIELYLGGDYKFLLCVCGLNAAMANYACLFCYVHAVSCHELSVKMNFALIISRNLFEMCFDFSGQTWTSSPIH